MRRLLDVLSDRLGTSWPVALAAVGIVAAMTPLRASFFEGAPYGHAALVTVAAIVVATLTPRSWSALLSLLVGLVTGVAVLLFAVADPPRVIGIPGDIGPLQLLVDVATGPSNLLAAPVPIEMSAQLLAMPLALCWAAGYVTVLAMRATDSAIASALPTVVTAVAVLVLGPGDLSVPAGVIVAVSVLAHVAARAAGVGHGAGGRVAAGSGDQAQLWRFALRSFALVGVPAVAVSTLVGATLAVVAAGDPARTDFHDAGGVAIEDELTPLSGLASQLLDEDGTELFTIELTGAQGLAPTELDRLRVATLERYDGALWTSGGVFLPVVRRVREPDSTGRDTRNVSAEVRLAPTYRSSYLPIAGLLQEVSGSALGLNEDTDTLVSGLPIGEPATIGFTSAVPFGARPDALSIDSPPGADAVGLDGVEVPEEFERFADEAAGDLTDPVERLQAIEAAMTDEDLFGYSVISSYSGHSLAVLANYLGPQPRDGFAVARQGYAEQAAAAFTILARMEGLPARVAVGYLLPDPQAVIDGEVVTVTTADAHAWSEVFLGDEWVAFEPTDRTERNAQEIPIPELDETVTAPPTIDEPVIAPRIRPEPVEVASASSNRWLVLVAAVLAGLLAIPVVVKWVRRRLRRRGPTSARLIGAWRELRDRLRDQGLPVSRSMTARDLGQRLNPDLADDVRAEYSQFVQLLDHGLFAQDEPADGVASTAWNAVPRLARRLAVGQPRWRRVLAPFNPGSLRRPPVGQPPTRVAVVDEPAPTDNANQPIAVAETAGAGWDRGGSP